jgi:hypothetical protein
VLEIIFRPVSSILKQPADFSHYKRVTPPIKDYFQHVIVDILRSL